MITDYGLFIGIDRDSIFESKAKQQVSLFCLDSKPVTTHNLLYPVNERIFTNWWQATLNEAVGEEFSIQTNGRMIIYRAF